MVGVIQVTGTSISVLVVDKFGRRKLLILSELFIGFAFCMLGSFFFVQVILLLYIQLLSSSRTPQDYNDITFIAGD